MLLNNSWAFTSSIWSLLESIQTLPSLGNTAGTFQIFVDTLLLGHKNYSDGNFVS